MGGWTLPSSQLSERARSEPSSGWRGKEGDGVMGSRGRCDGMEGKV